MLKLGKKPATPDARDLKMSAYLDTATLPTPPASFGLEKLVKVWSMLGNDQYGDCVWAGAAHETLLWDAIGHHDVAFSDQAVLSDYSACTGFNPDDPNTDQGTDMRVAASYRRKTGIVDSSGHRHKIGAYLSLAPGNLAHIELAAYLFAATGLGIQFPGSAMDQFNAGKPWDYVPHSTIEGGHYIPIVGKDNSYLYCVTWGKVQPMTFRFFAHYADEAFGYISNEDLVNGKSPAGFNVTQLKKDLAAL